MALRIGVVRSVAFIALLAAAGCAPVTVGITHRLPAAVPVCGLGGKITPGAFTVEGRSDGELASMAAKALIDSRPTFWDPGRVEQPPGGEEVTVNGLVRIKAADRQGRRPVRTLDSESGQLQTSEIPTLVRTIDIEVHFAVVRNGAADPVVTVETRRSYNSPADPRVRGELGLGRGDDPDLVPATEKIIEELLIQCARDFWSMVTPLVISRQKTLRLVGGADSSAGLQAAREGNLSIALERFEAAAEADPDSPGALYNLAVTAEATGDLTKALEAYRSVVSLTDRQDLEAAEAAEEIRLILIQQGSLAK